MSNKLYEQIAERTNGDVYIGVVGPVRVGKSTFVKRVMEVSCNSEYYRMKPNDYVHKMNCLKVLLEHVIMTAEPKFVPAQGTNIHLGEEQLRLQIRLVDCVGYMIDGVKLIQVKMVKN